MQRGFFRFLLQLLLRQLGRFLIAAQLFQLFDRQRRGHVMASEMWGFFPRWHATTEEFILQGILRRPARAVDRQRAEAAGADGERLAPLKYAVFPRPCAGGAFKPLIPHLPAAVTE
ncbi:hypothetical protein D3C79_708120 [compost metagenome]